MQVSNNLIKMSTGTLRSSQGDFDTEKMSKSNTSTKDPSAHLTKAKKDKRLSRGESEIFGTGPTNQTADTSKLDRSRFNISSTGLM